MDLSALEFTSPHAALCVVPKIFSYMVWPGDEHKRFSFIVNYIRETGVTIALDLGTGVEISGSFIRLQSELHVHDESTRSMLLNSLPIVVSGSSLAPQAPRIIGGQIAGQLLIEAVSLLYAGQGDISLKQCLETLSQKLTAAPKKTERAKRARPQDLKEHWQRYKSVAHLWAALMILIKVGREAEIETLLVQSELLCLDAAKIQHRNAKSPLIELEKSWRVPKDVIDVIVGT